MGVTVAPDFDALITRGCEWWRGIPDDLAPDVAGVEDALRQIGLRPRDVVRATADHSAAVAFRDFATAGLFRLVHAGPVRARMLDLEALAPVEAPAVA